MKYFSTTTGELILNFECKNKGDHIVNAKIPVTKKNKTLIGCTRNGKIVRWNLDTGKQEGEIIQLRLNQYAKITAFDLIQLDNSAVVGIQEKDGSAHICLYNLDKGQSIFEYAIPLKPKIKFNVATSNVEHRLIAVTQLDQLTILSSDPMKQHLKKTVGNMNKNQFTTLVFHPIEDALATGDESGRVIVWRNFFNSKQRPFSEVYHWHHTAVTTIAFSDVGTNFYSGGYEAVLVKWIYNDAQNKDFLPRLSAAIAHIAFESSQIIISTMDNSIQIYSPQFKLQRIVQEFTWTQRDFTGLSRHKVGLKINPRTQSIVLNGRVGHLQFFSTYTKRLLYNLDVTMTNYMCPEQNKLLFNTRVTHCCLNNDWLATGEYWTDFENSPEIRIKFFAFNQVKQSFSLNTNVEMPHNSELVGLEFSHTYCTTDLVCASAAHDHTIKIWALEKSPNIYKQEQAWMCVNVLTYKDLPVYSMNFSRDGTILAAGFENKLCLWEPDSGKLRQVLSAPPGVDGNIGALNIFLPAKNKSKAQVEEIKGYQKLVQDFLDGLNEDIINDVTEKFRQRFVEAKKLKIGRIDSPETKELIFRKVSQFANYLSFYQKTRVLDQLDIPFSVAGEDNVLIRYSIYKQKKLHAFRKLINFKVKALPRKTRFKTYVKLKTFLQSTGGGIERKPRWWKTYVNSRQVKTNQTDQKSDDTEESKQSNDSSDDEGDAKMNGVSNKNVAPVMAPMKMPTVIKFIEFGSNDYNHLVLVCTDHRIIIWNILTLRIEASVADEVNYLSIDPLTNLVAIVTKGNMLKVFQIYDLVPLYKRPMPLIFGMVWVPRRQAKGRTFLVDWQSTSQLIFLNAYQELICLASDREYNNSTLYSLSKDYENLNEYQSPFAAILTSDSKKQKTARQAVDWSVNRLTGKGLNVIQEVSCLICRI